MFLGDKNVLWVPTFFFFKKREACFFLTFQYISFAYCYLSIILFSLSEPLYHLCCLFKHYLPHKSIQWQQQQQVITRRECGEMWALGRQVDLKQVWHSHTWNEYVSPFNPFIKINLFPPPLQCLCLNFYENWICHILLSLSYNCRFFTWFMHCSLVLLIAK